MAGNTRTVTVNVVGNANGLTGVLGQAASQSESAGQRISGAFRSSFSTIAQASGGAFGPVSEVVAGLGNSMDQLSGKSRTMGSTLLGIGAASAGVGAALTSFGDKDKAAMQQLDQAFKNVGASTDDYKKQIDDASGHMAKFGYTNVQTANALTQLTTATKDPQRALDLMKTAADLAAQKHESLGTAVNQLTQIIAGKGTRVLMSLGIQHIAVAATTKTVEAATVSAQKADDSAANAKQKLADLEARQSAGHHTLTVSTAGVTSAQAALDKATQSLADKHALLAGKTSLTTAEQIGLRNAEQAVQAAQDKVAAAHDKVTAAQDKNAASAGLSVSQQQALRNAHDAVAKGDATAEAAHAKLTSQQDALTHSGNASKTMLDEVAKATSGQASAASDTFSGKMRALRAEVENQVSTLGQKYGPALSAVGAGMAGLGATMEIVRSITGKVKAAEDADALAKGAVTAATAVKTTAEAADTAAETAEATAATAADVASAPLILIVGGIVAAVALLGVGIYELATHWSQVWNACKNVVVGVWHAIDSDFIQPIEHFFEAIPGFIQSHWQLILAILTGPIGLAILFITQHFDQIKSTISRFPGEVVHFFDHIGQDFAKIGMDIVNGLVNGIKSMGGIIWDAIKSTIPGGGIIGGALSAIGLAEGGIVTKPTLAVVGEAGYPEAVIPLKNGVSALGYNTTADSLPDPMGGAPVGGGGAGDGGVIQVVSPIYLDSQKIGQAVAPAVQTALLQTRPNRSRTGLG